MLARLIPTEKTDPELAPFRSGLIFAFFNALTWQIGIGTPMVLFAEQLGASPLQVGLAYSFVFLLTPIQIVSTALLPRYGFKRVMLGGWGTRSVFLAVPAVLAVVALRIGVRDWMATVLVASVFWFCFFRSIGAAAVIPWLYAILPVPARGRYFGSDQFIGGVAGVGTLIACVVLFAVLPIYPALLCQYGIALIGSVLSYFALKQLPDAPKPSAISLRSVVRDTPRHMFTPSPFRRYLWLAVWYAVLSTPIPPFVAYYLKVVPALGPGQIMAFEVLRYSGVMVAAALIRRRIDATGARPFFLVTMVLYVFVAVFWWVFLRGQAHSLIGAYVAYFVLGLAAASWTIANLNYLPKVTSEEDRTLAVSIQGAVTACIGGLSPILWGLFLKTDSPSGAGIDTGVFQTFFAFVLVSVVILSSLLARLPEDTGTPATPLVIGNAIFRPFRAATYLVNLIEVPRTGPTAPAKDAPTARPPGGT